MAEPLTERNPYDIKEKEYLDALTILLDEMEKSGLATPEETDATWAREEASIAREGIHSGLFYYSRVIDEFPKFIERRAEAERKTKEGERGKAAKEQERRLIQEAVTRQKLAEAPSQVGTATGRAQLARLVDQGAIPFETAFGRGSAWETWQRKQADEFNLLREPTFDPTLSRKISGLLTQAEQEGIETTGFERSFRASLRAFSLGGFAGADPEQDVGNLILALQGQVVQKKQVRREQESQLLAGQFPDVFGQFEKQRGAFAPDLLHGGFSTRFTGFQAFAEKQPEFKEARLAKQTKMLKDFPILGREFQGASARERLGGFTSFVQRSPTRRTRFEQVQTEKTRPRRTRRVQFARI